MGEAWETKARAARAADPSADPIPRPHLVEHAKAVAVDAARLALNLGALSQAIATSADEYMALWKVGKQCADLLLEGERHLKSTQAELDAEREYSRDKVRSYEGRISAGMADNERLKGRVDEERERAQGFEDANVKLRTEIAAAGKIAAKAVADHAALERGIESATTIDDEASALRAQLERMRVADKAMRATICERLYLPPDTEWSGILPLIGKR